MTRQSLSKTESEQMKMTILKLVVVVAVSCSALLGCSSTHTSYKNGFNGLITTYDESSFCGITYHENLKVR